MRARTATGVSVPDPWVEGAKAPPARLTDEALDRLAAEVGRRAALVFVVAGWKYGRWDGDDYTPDAGKLAETVRGLIDTAGAEGTFNSDRVSATGRFTVGRWIDEDDNVECCSVSLEVGDATAPVPVQRSGGAPSSDPAPVGASNPETVAGDGGQQHG